MSTFICDGSCSGDDLGACTHGIEAVERRVKELERERDGLRERLGNLNTAREQLSAYNTRRFEAAMAAMQGMLSNDFKYEESISAKAVEYADALLAALERKS